MAQPKLFGKDLSAYDDIDIDELLQTLSPEELEELGTELIDPDVSDLFIFCTTRNYMDIGCSELFDAFIPKKIYDSLALQIYLVSFSFPNLLNI